MTLEILAKKFKVNKSTISRALNGNAGVSGNLRNRIIREAKEINYRPHAIGRALTTKKVKNIAFVVTPATTGGIKNLFYAEILHGVEDACRNKGYHVIFTTITEEINGWKGRLVSLPTEIQEKKVDGALIMGALYTNDLVIATQRIGIPVVLVNGFLKDVKIDSVVPDNVTGARQVVEYLVSLGHKQIGLISGPLVEINAMERLTGYRMGLETCGIEYDKRLVLESNYEYEGGYGEMEKFLKMSEPPTAVFACNDIMALGAMDAVRNRGLMVPKDMSIVGFDDIERARIVKPSLTTVSVFTEEMGRVAVRKIIERIEDKTKMPEKTVILTELVKRETCQRIYEPG